MTLVSINMTLVSINMTLVSINMTLVSINLLSGEMDALTDAQVHETIVIDCVRGGVLTLSLLLISKFCHTVEGGFKKS